MVEAFIQLGLGGAALFVLYKVFMSLISQQGKERETWQKTIADISDKHDKSYKQISEKFTENQSAHTVVLSQLTEIIKHNVAHDK